MRILAIDIGAGTQDILLYDSRRKEENNLKIVLPSPVQILAERIRKDKRKDILVRGTTMGGGAFALALLKRIREGGKVFITEKAAKSIRDDIDEVKKLGFKIISSEEAEEIGNNRSDNLQVIETKDVDFDYIFDFLKKINEASFDFIGIAVQDHGFVKGKSDRITRFSKIREILERENSLHSFLFSKPPDVFTRMRANYEHLKQKLEEKNIDAELFIVDTKIAAIAGAMHGVKEKPCMVFDIGNAHTMCAVVKERFSVSAIFEHHTALLNKKKIEKFARKLALGELTNEEIYSDDGHGAYVRERVGIENIKKIVVTGPKRDMVEGLAFNFSYAMPFGDIMLSGAVGIVDLIKEKNK